MAKTSESGADEPIAAITAILLLPVAIYLAFWRIDWGVDHGSLLHYILPVAFCIIAPSLIGSIVGSVIRAARRPG